MHGDPAPGVHPDGDYFALFGLQASFPVDRAALDAAYRDVQREVHPDRFAHATDGERRRAMEWAARANSAYQTLRSPLGCARYLLERRGIDLASESNTAMPAAFLMHQMELREAVAEAGDDVTALEVLDTQLADELDAAYEQLASALATGDNAIAAALLREQMFREKLRAEIDDALAELDATT